MCYHVHECKAKVNETVLVMEPAAEPDKVNRARAVSLRNHRQRKEHLATFRGMGRRTQRPAFQLEMFRGIILDPKILGELGRVRRG